MRPAPAPKVSNFVQLTHDGQPKFLVGTEGSRLYLYMTGRDYQGMAEMSTSGGEPRRLSILPSTNMTPLVLSPDGSELLLIDGHGVPPTGPLWSVPMLGGSPRKLGDITAQGGAWSPDGKSIAYSNGNNLFTAKADGSDARKIITVADSGFVFGPVWSPDGNHLRFMHESNLDNLTYFFMEVSLDGTGLHRLLPVWTEPTDRECCGSWSADGKYFLFLSRGQIWALAAKGRLSPLGTKTDSVDFQPHAVVMATFPAQTARRFSSSGALSAAS